MSRDFDAIVLGLGGIGAGALYWLARRLGGDVLGVERFNLGHERGSSQDHSRIIRYSYHRPFYVRLAGQAYETWAAVEDETGERIVVRTGGLDLFPEGGTIPASTYTESLDACGIEYQWLDAAAIRRRWPFTVADSVAGLYQAESGLVAAARANAAHLTAARSRGARVVELAEVTEIRGGVDEVEVVAGGVRYRARRAGLAAGAWTNELLGKLGLHLPLTVTREQVTYFSAPDLTPFAPERFPIWIWMDEPCFYGFPVFGQPAVKVAEDVGGVETTADGRSFEPDAAGLRRVREFCQQNLPSALGPELVTKTCLYTMPPDRDFILDQVPGHPAISMAVGAGHGFKFASAFGRILADLVIDGESRFDLEPFRADRSILKMADPPKSFFV
jgi:sarcosine oxidase